MVNGDYSYYKYNTFTIKYFDEIKNKKIEVESIRLPKLYKKTGNSCIIKVLGDDVLVIKADVKEIHKKLSIVDLVIIGIFIIIAILVILNNI